MTISSKEDLIKYLERNTPNVEGESYKEWSVVNPSFDSSLIKIGEIIETENQMTNDDYWGEDAPIDFSKYPYGRIEVYGISGSKNIYFRYLEQGGHRVEIRVRLIRKELIV